MGVAWVTSASFPDPPSDDPRWVVFDLAPVKALAEPVTLARIKGDSALARIPLVTQSRLSVMPLERAAFERILRLGKTRLERPRSRRPAQPASRR